MRLFTNLFKLGSLMLVLLYLFLFLVPAANAQYRSYSYGHNRSYGYNYYRAPYYTYSYPSYYGYGTNYYKPATYSYCAPTPAPAVKAPTESTTDKVLKELLVRKLLAEQGLGQPAAPVTPAALTAVGESPLSADEVAQLREVIKAIRERKPPNTKE